MNILAMIQEEFDNTLATDPFFSNRGSSTLVADIYKCLQYKKQEICDIIHKEVSELISRLPYPLTPEQHEALAVLRQGIRLYTSLDELTFRMTDQAAQRLLNADCLAACRSR